MVRKYQCCNEGCRHYFETEIPGLVICPKCHGIYVWWINYEEFLENGTRYSKL